jgi:hypothetical protein
MTRKLVNFSLFIALILLTTYCREPFEPDFETGKNDYLVVEGFIHVGQKAVTTITLSRVSPLMSADQVFEGNAKVVIESKNNTKFTKYPLKQEGNGNYQSDSLNLDPTLEYRLLITTEGGRQYYSDFIQSKASPPIDSLDWRWDGSFIKVFVNSHDDEGKTQYYKWAFEETWEFHADYRSKVTYVNGAIDRRNVIEAERMYYCWRSAPAENLHFASTTQLETDHIQYPLVTASPHSERLSVRYSIWVEQRALNKEEFEYLQIVQKNSTITGSLFDPMPSEIRGNIKSLDEPNEQVIGYIGAYATRTTRFFVSAEEINVDSNAKCSTVVVENEDYETAFAPGGPYTPIDTINSEQALAAPRYCMDCKLRGGSPVEPDFW